VPADPLIEAHAPAAMARTGRVTVRERHDDKQCEEREDSQPERRQVIAAGLLANVDRFMTG
jgi:hypothetical protein